MVWRRRPSIPPGLSATQAVRAFAILAAGALSLRAAEIALGIGVPGTAWLSSDALHGGLEATAAALCLLRAQVARQDRGAWLLVGTGLFAYGVGDGIWNLTSGGSAPSFPTIADGFWISFYLLVIAGTALLVHGHVRLSQRALWLDAAIGGAVVAAVGLPAVLAAGLGFAGSSTEAAAVNITYPVLDLSLVAVRHVPPVAVGLALVALVGLVCRTWLTIREIQRLWDAHAAALRDDLTGLGNRRSLYEEIERRIGAGGSQRLAVLLLDLDSFKDLNDVLGHDTGDLLLIEVATRLRETARAGEFIVRMGGDEFAVLLETPSGPDTAGAVAARILTALDRSFLLDGMRLHVGASIGAALHPEHGRDTQTLLRHADIAMYDAKGGGDAYRMYRDEAETRTREGLMLAEELRHAVGNRELEVHYQPKALLSTGEITGVEALVRWRHPTRGLLAPTTFLAAAERAGTFRAMSRHLLDTALWDCGRWQAAGHNLSVAVNLSTIDLLDPDLACEFAERLAQHGVSPRHVRVEVTEEVVMSDPDRAQAVLESLAAEGIGIALDDFGTGYSSLARLTRLPVTELKIDRSFVACMTTDPGRAAIVRSTIHLAHDLGLTVVAEGVEQDEQWELLAGLGCDEAQGYLLSKPVPARELEELLARPDRRAA